MILASQQGANIRALCRSFGVSPTTAYELLGRFRASGDNGLHSCEKRSRIEGSAGFVTGAFGLACASVVVRGLIGR